MRTPFWLLGLMLEWLHVREMNVVKLSVFAIAESHGVFIKRRDSRPAMLAHFNGNYSLLRYSNVLAS
jgi:hypothetical protein